MTTIHSRYLGHLKIQSVHELSGVSLQTAAPLDNNGDGSSFSPTDLVATALGNCMLTVMGILAERHQLDLSGSQITVEKHMISEPVRRIGRLVVVFSLPNLPEKERPRLERAAEKCPVKQSLHPDIQIEVTYNWGTV